VHFSRSIGSVTVLFLLALVSPVRSESVAGRDEAQIRAALAGWVQAFNSGDLKKAAEVWAPDLVGWSPEGTDDTYAVEKEYAAKGDGKLPGATYALTINEVIVSCDLAVVRDTWTETPRKDPSKSRTFRSFEVWRRQTDGAWKISRWIDGPISEASPSAK